ncbi:transcriptional regulator with XRE-family HTH domain [Natronospira proteinivora]|uniref:Transcriptional regulator with XRE-family HTH domain n=1 Tax=Natronospira proteinivora TaxID=1807133 RepID=A0ABT1G9B7_9GAMM|nr:helix-turn-helix domain-containing protein [Natronospira proteinivora]MCP1727907.1 transcriptional regulator with XRE-family HTH domain [Natronospira proteinivora]
MQTATEQTLQTLARQLGANLRAARKRRFPGDTQSDFARRIGVSHYTWRKMEKGDPSVAMGSYLRAAHLLGLAEALVAAFHPPEPSLFDRRSGP